MYIEYKCLECGKVFSADKEQLEYAKNSVGTQAKKHIREFHKMDIKDYVVKHYFNGKQLRIMYAAYGIIRGKSYSQIENYYSEEMHPLKQFDNQIQKLVEKYAKEVVCSDK